MCFFEHLQRHSEKNLILGRLQIEHDEMCCDSQLNVQVGLKVFYKTYLDKDKYPAIYKHALWMVSLFGNT